MSTDVHFDGGHLRRSSVIHEHVIEHSDGQVSAIVVRGVPALVCELCEESYYEPAVTDVVVALLKEARVGPGEAVAVDYRSADAA
jgi:YgiT-type zinc finger domain-containing protein